MERELTYDDIRQVAEKIEQELNRDDEKALHEGFKTYTKEERDIWKIILTEQYSNRLKRGLAIGGNNKNKPKIYKNKIILGKERGIYKIPGSRKDYIKYKGKFIAVKDFIKLKNK